MASSTTSGRNAVGNDGRGVTDDKGRTPAQWYCTLAGLALLLAGIFGFIADSTFDTGSSADPEGGNVGGGLQGDSFLGFEVNGWHNVVHLLSGLFLLAMMKKRKTAKTAALAFGIVYGIVAIIGLIDGSDVLGLIPVNPADNVLHILLSLAGIAAALVSRGDDHDDHRSVGTGRARAHEGGVTTGRTTTGVGTGSGSGTDGVAGSGRTLRPEDHDQTRGGR
jgi:hypothetical protein